MKQPIRFFAIGLLTSAILLLGVYYLDQSEVNSAEIPIEEMISEVETNGYRVITEQEYISYTLAAEEQEEQLDSKKENAGKDNDETTDQEVEEQVEDTITYTLKIVENVMSQDVAESLIINNIIDDKQKFLDFLEDNEYSSYIQIGEFEVASDMSYEEIAKLITNR